MKHRHLERSDYSLPAIDDIISRGKWVDWVDLQHELVHNPEIRVKIQQVCEAYITDPYAQRYHFWWKNIQQPT